MNPYIKNVFFTGLVLLNITTQAMHDEKELPDSFTEVLALLSLQEETVEPTQISFISDTDQQSKKFRPKYLLNEELVRKEKTLRHCEENSRVKQRQGKSKSLNTDLFTIKENESERKKKKSLKTVSLPNTVLAATGKAAIQEEAIAAKADHETLKNN